MLTNYLNDSRRSVRTIARLLADGSTMSAAQIKDVSGLSHGSIGDTLRMLNKQGLIYIDRYTGEKNATRMWRMGNKPNAQRPLSVRVARRIEKQEHAPALGDYNQVMYSFVRAA